MKNNLREFTKEFREYHLSVVKFGYCPFCKVKADRLPDGVQSIDHKNDCKMKNISKG